MTTREQVIALAKEVGADDLCVRYSEVFLETLYNTIFAAGQRDEREACIRIVETYRVSVGNSPAGELACEWTMNSLRDIRDQIRERDAQ